MRIETASGVLTTTCARASVTLFFPRDSKSGCGFRVRACGMRTGGILEMVEKNGWSQVKRIVDPLFSTGNYI